MWLLWPGPVLSTLHKNIHLFILQILLSISWASGIILDIVDTGITKTGKVSCSQVAYIVMGKNKQ